MPQRDIWQCIAPVQTLTATLDPRAPPEACLCANIEAAYCLPSSLPPLCRLESSGNLPHAHARTRMAHVCARTHTHACTHAQAYAYAARIINNQQNGWHANALSMFATHLYQLLVTNGAFKMCPVHPTCQLQPQHSDVHAGTLAHGKKKESSISVASPNKKGQRSNSIRTKRAAQDNRHSGNIARV